MTFSSQLVEMSEGLMHSSARLASIDPLERVVEPSGKSPTVFYTAACKSHGRVFPWELNHYKAEWQLFLAVRLFIYLCHRQCHHPAR